MSIGHKHRHTGRSFGGLIFRVFAQNGTAGSKNQGSSTGPMGRGILAGRRK